MHRSSIFFIALFCWLLCGNMHFLIRISFVIFRYAIDFARCTVIYLLTWWVLRIRYIVSCWFRCLAFFCLLYIAHIMPYHFCQLCILLSCTIKNSIYPSILFPCILFVSFYSVHLRSHFDTICRFAFWKNYCGIYHVYYDGFHSTTCSRDLQRVSTDVTYPPPPSPTIFRTIADEDF